MSATLISVAVQFWIAVTAIVSLWLMVTNRPGAGALVGLVGQPAWLYASLTGHQYGILAVAVVMTGIYLCAAWEHVLVNPRRNIWKRG